MLRAISALHEQGSYIQVERLLTYKEVPDLFHHTTAILSIPRVCDSNI